MEEKPPTPRHLCFSGTVDAIQVNKQSYAASGHTRLILAAMLPPGVLDVVKLDLCSVLDGAQIA